MRLVVEGIGQEGNKTVVRGKTLIGEIKGVWKHAEPPVIGKDYSVELKIDAPNEVEIPSKMNTFPFVYLDNDSVVFGGVCEGLDNEIYYLRFEADWMEMLDIDVTAVKKEKGDSISFAADYCRVGIYPYILYQ